MNPPRLPRHLCMGLALGVTLLVHAPAGAADAPNLAGTWTWEWKDGQGTTHRHVLDVEGTGTTLAARERFDDQEPVKVDDLKVQGKQVTFSVERGARRAVYTGTLDGADTINGKVAVTAENAANQFAWTARRKPAGTP